ncbi:MAG: asparagine synthase (glutamine-hydrolyzing) [Ruminiclostridium sp.]|nr:asparagine synthase (glutamine-hydrolyzing) [Ruminiclostridium sp.]
MCGIAGWINHESDLRPQSSILEAMSYQLRNRGPDASGDWISPHALISHRRLSVVDPEGGSQPMVRQWDGCTYVITYNGELYNTIDLRKDLENLGHKFYSNSDTEVLLVSYMEWGGKCVEHLNGIYAFGIWNEKDQTLFLARDRFGVKPLFYTLRGNSFIFASELKAMLANPLIEAVVDTEGLAEIFALGPARTPGNGVFKYLHELKPAYCLFFDSAGIHLKKYWSLESQPHFDTLDATIENVRELVVDSIERQFTADVPVCCFLSGGLDSSAITALASEYFHKHGKILNTYSIEYRDNEKYFAPSLYQPDSDTPWIKKMSDEFGTHHHYITVDTPQVVEALDSAVEARDLPGMADIDSSLWLFCREVKKGATVALSGECADEVFGGYPWFFMEDMLNAGTFPWSANTDERKKVMSKDLLNEIGLDEYVYMRYSDTVNEVPHLPGETQIEARRREMFYLNFTWFMQTLLDRKDRMSMASGLEVRVPYCDHRLVQYLWNIPWSMKMLKGREKGLLRKALEGIIPDDVLWRKKSPYPKTHNPSYEKAVKARLLDILNDASSPLLPLIDKAAITDKLAKDSDYSKPWFGQLMAGPQMYAYLIQVDYWLRKYRVRLI